jgi:hypothetical protein
MVVDDPARARLLLVWWGSPISVALPVVLDVSHGSGGLLFVVPQDHDCPRRNLSGPKVEVPRVVCAWLKEGLGEKKQQGAVVRLSEGSSRGACSTHPRV